ncbi:hypothetical protein AUJ87_04470 [Candidatus Gracilibacteria bacterium CG1_02_38_174]|nr:MAG: hypothetical protein AUJ87_04470 [Candidatus Gracilibacteria bacterium CG1_02_38_174]PIQ11707.1 MAG: hypothetical protein COW68_02160 [Candidatus Gracilibacteria bacterium CG18_big_fil_WC_8_21_14_2_50_38_16]
MGIIMAMGLTRIYSTFFGTVLGMGIFVLISTILSPEFQTPETLSLISDTFAKVLIGSSVYLIFILALLVPMNGGINVSLPKSALGMIFQTLILSFILVLFLLAVFLGLVDKSYIFLHTDSAFILMNKFASFSELQSSLLFVFVSSHLPTIIILSIGFIIYKMLFADIVNTTMAGLIENIKKKKVTSGGDHHDRGHEEHGEFMDEGFMEHEEGHGGHSGHGHH